ncbi:MAG: PqqD family protein [Deltaproteobacteria bacterium]|nr:PqqD family protein [Deltaproteobacteria bacterium]MBW1737323.1 PqqD family protein [Deltaproteobacteria bacterium]MBW1910190.1 PqqD family protein [Deltaproteobacteria bacterium]MBW2032872.1 PqqD family protein [Deltaproteobacteria bacterium]MBW2114700.1 PqqD family protein [Deltaproteobacteria bacterium]
MSTDLDMNAIPFKDESIMVRRVKDEDYLVRRDTRKEAEEKLWVLNPTASFIWERIDGKRRCRDILDELIGHFDSEADLIKQDFIALLLQLRDQDLLTLTPAASLAE